MLGRIKTGNGMIDGDDGSHPQSPRFSEPDPIISTVDIHYWDSVDEKWKLDSSYELEDVAVSKDELCSWISDQSDVEYECEMNTIKNDCDHVILEEVFSTDEKTRYEFYYE